MEIDRKELKTRAKASMALTRPKFWVVSLTYLLLAVGVPFVINYLPVTGVGAALFLTLFSIMFRFVVDFGLDLWSLWTCRRLDPGLDSLIQGFSVVGRVLMMNLGIYARVFCWTLVAILAVAMVIPVALLTESLSVAVTVSLVVMVAVYVAVWVISMRYSLAPYLLADRPDDGSTAAIRRSVELMRGWKFELFKLEFSFLGWYILQEILSGLMLAFLLWQSGFFTAVLAFSGADLTALISGWISLTQGVSPDVMGLAPAVVEALDLFTGTVGSTAADLLTQLITLPVLLFFTPYLSVTRAEFYNARLLLQKDNAPEL